MNGAYVRLLIFEGSPFPFDKQKMNQVRGFAETQNSHLLTRCLGNQYREKMLFNIFEFSFCLYFFVV